MSLDYVLWLGTQAAHDTLLEAAEKYHARAKSGDSFSDMFPPLLQVQDGVGVISVSGPMVSGSAGFMRLFGVLGYDDIAQAFVAAVEDKSVKSILASYDTGGGHASGVADLGELIRSVDQVKPVITHTGGDMMSAGYWLGVCGRKVYATSTSEVGSIGVLMVTMERSRALEQAGIKVNVIRAGKFKALANPYEPLTDVAREQLEAKAETLHTIFLNHVGENRGLSGAAVKKKFGEGQTFLGITAKELGMTDGVANFSEAVEIAKLEVGKPADNLRRGLSHRMDGPISDSYTPAQPGYKAMKLKNPTAVHLAMLANGATEAQLTAAGAVVEQETTAPAPAAPVTPPVTVTAAVTTPAPTTDLTTFLQTQNVELHGKVATLTAQVASLTGQAASDKQTQDALLAIVRASVSNMSVALSGQAGSGDALPAAAVLAEHARLSTEFQKKYPTGGVAATAPKEQRSGGDGQGEVDLTFFSQLTKAAPASA